MKEWHPIFRRSENGFTLLELLVTVAIAAAITGVVMAGVKQGERSRSSRVAADSIQSALRLMQGNTLSGALHTSGNPARDFGWQLNASQNRYQTFTEESNTVSPYNKTIIETYNFPANVVIDSGSLVVGGTAATSLEIRFIPPYGEILTTGGGTSFSEAKNVISSFMIRFQGTSIARTVTIDGISGRINVQ